MLKNQARRRRSVESRRTLRGSQMRGKVLTFMPTEAGEIWCRTPTHCRWTRLLWKNRQSDLPMRKVSSSSGIPGTAHLEVERSSLTLERRLWRTNTRRLPGKLSWHKTRPERRGQLVYSDRPGITRFRSGARIRRPPRYLEDHSGD